MRVAEMRKAGKTSSRPFPSKAGRNPVSAEGDVFLRGAMVRLPDGETVKVDWSRAAEAVKADFGRYADMAKL